MQKLLSLKGRVQEWFNWQSWKDCVPKGTESSNLSPSADAKKMRFSNSVTYVVFIFVRSTD